MNRQRSLSETFCLAFPTLHFAAPSESGSKAGRFTVETEKGGRERRAVSGFQDHFVVSGEIEEPREPEEASEPDWVLERTTGPMHRPNGKVCERKLPRKSEWGTFFIEKWGRGGGTSPRGQVLDLTTALRV